MLQTPLPADEAERGLVSVRAVDGSLQLDVRYATANNVLGRAVYPPAARDAVWLQRPAAEALARVQSKLKGSGLGLLIFDGYRPLSVTRLFWEATPPPQRHFVANPATGSRHNRGCAVDLSLCRASNGSVSELSFPSAFDEFSESAHSSWRGGTEQQRANRQMLRSAMEAEGFTVLAHEWWHFDYVGWERYPLLDVAFEELELARTQCETVPPQG